MTVLATQMFKYRPQKTAAFDSDVVIVKVVVNAERGPHTLRDIRQIVTETRSETEYVAVGVSTLDRGRRRLRSSAGATLTVASRKHC
jgi:predicted nucleic-acid-binding protein